MQRVNYDDLEMDDRHGLCHARVPFTGTAYELSPTGQLIGEACFVSGVQEGPTKDFFPNGQLASEDRYQHGSKHGECWRWYASGQPRERAVYEYSILLEAEEWDELQAASCGSTAWTSQSPQFRTLELLRHAHRRGTSMTPRCTHAPHPTGCGRAGAPAGAGGRSPDPRL